MTNDELKKKIVDVLIKVDEYVRNEIIKAVEEHRAFLTEDNQYYYIVADALIASVIGDVKDLQAQVDSLEITNISLQAGYDDAEKDRLYWVDKYKEAEHRAEVAEKALKHAVNVYIAHTETSSKKKWWYKYFLREAEKEFAEERKDEN